MTVARQGMPRQQLQQQSGVTSHMEMLRLFGVACSVFQHSGPVTARRVEKNQGQFWPLFQEKMPCEGEDVMRRNCLPAVLKITFAGLSSSSTLESSKFAFAVGGCASGTETEILILANGFLQEKQNSDRSEGSCLNESTQNLLAQDWEAAASCGGRETAA